MLEWYVNTSSSTSGETFHTLSVALYRLSMGEDDSLSLPLELVEYLFFLFEVISHRVFDFSGFCRSSRGTILLQRHHGPTPPNGNISFRLSAMSADVLEWYVNTSSSTSGETFHTLSVALYRLSMGEDDSLSLPLELVEYLCFLFEVISHRVFDFSGFCRSSRGTILLL